MMKFYDKEKNKSRLDSLANALSKRDNTPINIGTINGGYTNNTKSDNVMGGTSDLLSGATKLYGGLRDSGLFNKPTGDFNNTLLGGNYFGSNSTGSMTMDNVLGNSGSGSMVFDSLGQSTGFNGMPLIGNAIGGLNGYASTGDWKDGIQGIFGTNSNDSDIMQGIKGTANGAMTGASIGGPWGAVIGGLLGLGSSFIDDI